MSRLSRRGFLGATAGVVGALAAPRIAVGQQARPSVDVAIVGGGISGLFCAMRLQAAGHDVAVFEASDRLGGRVMSVLLPGFSDHAAEIGAMRLRTTDAVEIRLIDTLLGADGRPLPASLAESLPISRLMAEEVWGQVKKTHALPDASPPPILGTYRNWGKDPLYGAGIHLWAIGTDAEDTMKFMREPFPNVYVCGEAWSRDQGWIKGATATAETVLQQKFGLPPYLSA